MTFASTIINEYLSFKPFHIDGGVEHSESEAEDASKRVNFLSACTSKIYACETTSKSCLNSLANRVALALPCSPAATVLVRASRRLHSRNLATTLQKSSSSSTFGWINNERATTEAAQAL